MLLCLRALPSGWGRCSCCCAPGLARSAPHQSWHWPLLCSSACCWDAVRTGTESLALLAQCSRPARTRHREKDQTNPKRASKLNQNRPLRGQEEGRASFPMDPKFNSPSKNSNPRRGRKGNQKNKRNRRGRRGLVDQTGWLPSSLSLFYPH